MRTFSSSLLAALIIAALFWGNCFSCPQALLSARNHGCCHRTKQASSGCQTQALQHFVKAEFNTQAPPVVAVAALPAPPMMLIRDWPPVPDASEHAPPDLLSLHSSYRI
jgi:hypothetical protein